MSETHRITIKLVARDEDFNLSELAREIDDDLYKHDLHDWTIEVDGEPWDES